MVQLFFTILRLLEEDSIDRQTKQIGEEALILLELNLHVIYKYMRKRQTLLTVDKVPGKLLTPRHCVKIKYFINNTTH